MDTIRPDAMFRSPVAKEAGWHMPPPVVIVECNGPLRSCLQHLLAGAGYSITALSTFDSVLDCLRTCADPVVVMAGNATPSHTVETTFFAAVAADSQVTVGHRYVLLTTTPEHLPSILRLQLTDLGVPILKKPFDSDDVLHAVADALGRIAGPQRKIYPRTLVL
jgi:CheY-like chemotaxis protein